MDVVLTLAAHLLIATSSSAECPALFGDAESRVENRADRKAMLRFIDVSPHAITIVHTGHWEEPTEIEFTGLELVASKRRARAIFKVGGELEGFGCKPGEYAARVDDEIGDEARVVAILDDLVLVEHTGELRYLSPHYAPAPHFSMVWSSDFSMNGYLRRKPSPAPAQKKPARTSR